jgi:hypothetical protein
MRYDEIRNEEDFRTWNFDRKFLWQMIVSNPPLVNEMDNFDQKLLNEPGTELSDR